MLEVEFVDEGHGAVAPGRALEPASPADEARRLTVAWPRLVDGRRTTFTCSRRGNDTGRVALGSRRVE